MPAHERHKRHTAGGHKDCGCSRPGRGCCGGLLPYIDDFIEGDAGKRACERIRRHLRGCKNCRMHLDLQIGVIRLYKKWRAGTMPDAVRVRLHQRLDEVISHGASR